MQAPFVEPNQKSRQVVLPGKTAWYDASEGCWIKGGRKITAAAKPLETPLYIRDGAILPLARLAEGDHAFNGKLVDFHIYLSGNATAQTRYVFDDGHSFAYRKGKRSEVKITARRTGAALAITVHIVDGGYGKGEFTFTTEKIIRAVSVNGVRARRVSPQGVAFGTGKLTTWSL
jgi:alpha-glucosidase (family GH31 glycosyl hydrolase)